MLPSMVLLSIRHGTHATPPRGPGGEIRRRERPKVRGVWSHQYPPGSDQQGRQDLPGLQDPKRSTPRNLTRRSVEETPRDPEVSRQTRWWWVECKWRRQRGAVEGLRPGLFRSLVLLFTRPNRYLCLTTKSLCSVVGLCPDKGVVNSGRDLRSRSPVVPKRSQRCTDVNPPRVPFHLLGTCGIKVSTSFPTTKGNTDSSEYRFLTVHDPRKGV